MKPENRFRVAVHKLLPPAVYHVKMNNPFAGGIPDDWYSGSRSDLWVEYKWLPALPKRDTTVIVPALEPLQRSWCDGRYKEGRRVRVVVGFPTGCIIFASPEEWNAGIARGKAQVLSKQQLANWIRDHVVEHTSAGGPRS